MRGINKVTLVGHLGNDPEVKVLEGGATVANFSIATNESFKNKEGVIVPRTEWHNVAMWRGLATVAEKYLKKGSLVYVEGRLKTNVWEDENGKKHYSTEVVGSNLVMLEGKPEEHSAPPKKKKVPAAVVEEPATDLPF